MIGIVLAAGAGRRLRPDTDVLPKTLLPVAGRTTILDIALRNLAAVGLTEIESGPCPQDTRRHGLEPFPSRAFRTLLVLGAGTSEAAIVASCSALSVSDITITDTDVLDASMAGGSRSRRISPPYRGIWSCPGFEDT